MGPGSWSEARQTIMTQQERILFPLATRKVEEEGSKAWLYVVVTLFFLFVAFILFN